MPKASLNVLSPGGIRCLSLGRSREQGKRNWNWKSERRRLERHDRFLSRLDFARIGLSLSSEMDFSGSVTNPSRILDQADHPLSNLSDMHLDRAGRGILPDKLRPWGSQNPRHGAASGHPLEVVIAPTPGRPTVTHDGAPGAASWNSPTASRGSSEHWSDGKSRWCRVCEVM